MKQILYLSLFLLIHVAASSQPIHQVTVFNGSQILGNNTVTNAGNAGTGTAVPNVCVGNTYSFLGGGGNRNFSFVLSNPVSHVRFQLLMNPHDSVQFTVNNVNYALSPSEVTKAKIGCHFPGANPTYTPVIVNGKLGVYGVPTNDSFIQVDIQGTAINSVSVTDYSYNNWCVFKFFFADTGMYIQQPYNDTLYCPGDSLFLPYGIEPAFFTNNTFNVQLSNAAGSFATPTVIGYANTTNAGTIKCRLPFNIPPGNGYRVRIVSTAPVRMSQDNGANIRIKAGPTSKPVAGTNAPICEGVTLNLTSSNAGTGVSYAWTGPATASVQNPSFANAMLSHSGDYVVTATVNNECAQKDTVTVLIKPIPAVPTANNNSPLCPGETLNLTSSSTTVGVSYTWTGPVTVTPTQNPTFTNVTAGHDGVYNVTATLNGCTSAAGSTTVTIKPVPSVPTAASNSPVCTGGILNLTAGSSTPGVTYSWTGPGGFASTAQNPTIDPAAPANAGIYDVTATLNGCTSAAGSTSVVVNTVSYLGAYASPNDTICEGTKLTVVTVPTNGGSSPLFQWFKNGVAVAGQTKLTYPMTDAATGDTFYCRMIAGNICNTPITLFSNKIGITVLPKDPTPAVNITSVPGQPLPGNAVTFTANLTSGTGISYQWQRNGQDVAGATSNTWSASNLNPYDKISVKATTDKPCPDSSTALSNVIEVNFPTGINDVNKTQDLQLFPNPNKGSFSITGGGSDVSVEVVNALGQTIYQQTHKAINGKIDIALPATAAGLYTVKAGGEVMLFVVE